MTPVKAAAGELFIDLWCVDLSVHNENPHFSATLSPDERERADKFHFAIDRHRYIASHYALRHILARYCASSPAALRFARGPSGKPFLEGIEGVSFNLSHSHERAVVAVCVGGSDIGVDIEYVDDQLHWGGLADLIFTENEKNCLAQGAEDARAALFFDIWTRKEAVAKAQGTGFLMDFKSFCTAHGAVKSLAATPSQQDAIRYPACESGWQVYPVALAPGYACAVACRLDRTVLRRYRFSDGVLMQPDPLI